MGNRNIEENCHHSHQLVFLHLGPEMDCKLLRGTGSVSRIENFSPASCMARCAFTLTLPQTRFFLSYYSGFPTISHSDPRATQDLVIMKDCIFTTNAALQYDHSTYRLQRVRNKEEREEPDGEKSRRLTASSGTNDSLENMSFNKEKSMV